MRVHAASCAASVVESSSFQTSNGRSEHLGHLSEDAASPDGAVGAVQGLTFQEAVIRLQQYWADQAECVIYMPTNTEVSCCTGLTVLRAICYLQVDTARTTAMQLCTAIWMTCQDVYSALLPLSISCHPGLSLIHELYWLPAPHPSRS